MGTVQYTFQRYERKYMMTREQYEKLLPRLDKYLKLDEYGRYTICNIYYDNDDYELIRRSIEKPNYKEKFRMRSYGVPGDSTPVYAEIKKKYDGIVYKRRIAVDPQEYYSLFREGKLLRPDSSQIRREIQWFFNQYHCTPKVYLAYERLAFAGKEDPNFRLTFDTNIRWRTDNVDLRAGTYGKRLFDDDRVLMELKISDTTPMWLTKMLSELEIRRVSFSKIGTVYEQNIAQQFFLEKSGRAGKIQKLKNYKKKKMA